MPTGTDVGYYTLPVILSFEGVEKNVNSKLGKVFGDAGKKSSKAFADNTEADLKRVTDSYSKMRDKAEDALGKIRVEEERLKKARSSGKADQIAIAEERLNKARRDSNRLNREAAASYDQVTAAQKRMTDSTSKTSSGLSSLLSRLGSLGGAAKTGGTEAATGFVSGFGGPIAALGTKAGPIGLALAATAGLGLIAGKVLGDQIIAGMSQLQDQAGVAAKLGLTAEQMQPIAKAAAAAYAANFGDSVAQNLDTARAAVQGGILDPDANQADVERIVAQLTTVAAVTGETIPAAVRTAQQAVRTGLATNITEAFDLIVKAQQQGLNVSQDLFDTINEYGTQFRKLGLNGAEAFGLIAQAVQGGARDTDTAADALKEFSIRAIDGSKLTGQAYRDLGLSFKGTTEAFAAGGDTAKAMFQEVVDRIAAVEDPAKRAQIQVALFGTKAEDLGNAVNSMDLNTAVTQFGGVEGAAAQAAETLGGTAAGSIEQAKRNIEVAVDNMQQGLARAFGPALKEVADWVIAHQDDITGFFINLGVAAIRTGEVLYKVAGGIAGALGTIVGGVGDVLGAVNKIDAWLARRDGDNARADSLEEQAESYFSWGEGLVKFAESADAFNADKMVDVLKDAGEQAKNAGKETKGLTAEVDKLDGKDVSVPIEVAGIDAASRELDDFFAKYNEMSINPQLGDPLGATAGGLLGAGVVNPSSMGVGRTGSESGLTQTSTNAKRAIENAFPAVESIGGWRPPDGYNEHFSGQALDIMIPDWGSASGKAYGDKVAQYLLANASALGVDYILWQQRQWNADGTSSPMGDRGSPTENHMDHVHAHTVKSPQLPGASAPSAPVTTATLPGSSAMSGAIGSTPGLTSGIDTSKLYSAGPQSLTNAYGPGFEPGIGTPGVDEYGKPGYYRVDERRLQDAQRSATNAQRAVGEADAAAQAARDARAALNDTPFVDATQIAGADKAVRDAEWAASEARLDAANAAQDAAEAAKGEFTQAKKMGKESKGKGGDAGLGALGSIGSSFLKETFGIGDWLPGLDNLLPLQMADGLMNAAMGPLTGFMQGGLGIQTPGWTPGMSSEEFSQLSGGTTTNSAFGIPEIGAPPMPAGDAHGGSGTPGPGNVINIDQSQNFNNSPVGSDPAQVEKQRQANINRAPRLPVGMGS